MARPGTPDGSSQQTALSQRLTAAGIDCGSQQLEGHVSCNYQGQNVTVTPGAWSDLTVERKKVCDSGFISAETVVATDDSTLTVAGNYPSQVRGIAKALGIGVEPYCPS